MPRVFLRCVLPLLLLTACLQPAEFVYKGTDSGKDIKDARTGDGTTDLRFPETHGKDLPGNDLKDVSDIGDGGVTDVPDVGDGGPGDATDGGDGGPLDGGDGGVTDTPSGETFDAAEVEADVCVPACSEKECGDDGCGGTCGECAEKWICDEGTCTPDCEALCEGIECGYALPDENECPCENCDDGDPCTEDLCALGAGKCAFPAVDDEDSVACDDGNVCTAGDVCVGGECVGEFLPYDELKELQCVCAKDEDCIATEDGDVCNGTMKCQKEGEATEGICVVDATSVPDCSDENPCTDDDCDPVESCTHTDNTLPCDDEDVCTVQDTCSDGECGGTPKEEVPIDEDGCDDGNVCTADTCNPEDGACASTSVPAEEQLACDDSNPCTLNDICDGEGLCVGTDKVLVAFGEGGCEDGLVCTDHECNPETGECTMSFSNAPCNDGNPCTTGDQCANGNCTSTGWDSCDDGNDCTADSCIAFEGCDHTPKPGPCSDDDPCTKADVCADGVCTGTPYECTDDLDCTENVCTGDGGCSFPLSEAWCLIDEECVEEGTPSPENPCLACLPDESTEEYSPDDTQACGSLPFALTTACVAGVCTVVDCELGRGHCDDSQVNGCETDTTADLLHCGGCNKPCDAGQVCSMGECKNECDEGLTKCDPVGCVDTQVNPLFCGNCETVCDYENAKALCVEGQCAMGDCLDMWGDANGQDGDGCECMITNMGTELCNTWDDDCNGIVDDVDDALVTADPVNCGECGNVCPAGTVSQTAVCADKECGLADCGENLWDLNEEAADGCEYECIYAGEQESCNELDDNCDGVVDEGFDLATDLENCGACGNQCAHASVSEYLCAGGKCIVLTCNEGFKDANNIGSDGCELAWQPDGELWVDSWDGGTYENGFDGSEDFPFSTIQEAIDYAFDGYLIHVREGIYTGGIEIDIPNLTIQGAGQGLVFVSTPDYGTGFHITSDNFSISGMAISGGQYGVHFQGTEETPLQGGEAKSLTISQLQAPDGEGADAAGVKVEWGVGVGVVASLAGDVSGGKGQNWLDCITQPCTGGHGGHAAGIAATESGDFWFAGNTITGITGGTGGDGSSQGAPSGEGGIAAGVLLWTTTDGELSANSAGSITGGHGGMGPGGFGGGETGGAAAGFYLFQATAPALWANDVAGVAGGKGGATENSWGTTGTGGMGAGVLLKQTTQASLSGNAFQGLTGGDGGTPGGAKGQKQVAFGVYLDDVSRYSDLGTSNTVDGFPIIYLRNASGVDIQGMEVSPSAAPTNWGGMVFLNSTEVNVQDNVIVGLKGASGRSGGVWRDGDPGGDMAGILLEDCTNCTVQGNTVEEISGGVGGTGGKVGQANKFKAGDGGGGVGLRVLNSPGVVISGNRFGSVFGGNAGIRAYAQNPGRPGSGVGIELSNSGSAQVASNLTAHLGTGQNAPGDQPPLAPTACVSLKGTAFATITHLACAAVQSVEPDYGCGVAIVDDGPELVQVVNAIFSDISGYCLYSDDANAPTLLSAAHSDLHNCGLGQAYNATVAATCISEDPLFVDPENGDFHLQPESPCIDVGKPSSDYENEPLPNGCRVNMGAYGNTGEATSKVGAMHCTADCDGQANCAGKECGDDGCGGQCGVCGEGTLCDPTGVCGCLFLACGDSCCAEGEQCGVNGECCVYDCTDKVCGDDGCGGVCGTCDEGYECNGMGQCVEIVLCGNGICDELEDCMTCPEDCLCGCGEECVAGTCAFTACDGKECGPDGCGGGCGTCGAGEFCSQGDCLQQSPPVALTAGREHTCILKGDGTAWCWGSNSDGQLGDGTKENRSYPVRAQGILGATKIAAGAAHTCAVQPGGEVWCWGLNSSGQLGDGTNDGKTTPVQVIGLTGMVGVAAGADHTCAWNAAGNAWCWGKNEFGQLGDSTTAPKNAPVAVTGLTGVVGMEAGNFHTCAYTSGGKVWCWGRNNFGQLGDATNGQKTSPVELTSPTGIGTVAAGYGHTCASSAAGTWCWGFNATGQLGNNSISNSNTPAAVSGLAGGSAVAAGEYHSCVVDNDGAVWCWGYNATGQLGDGTDAQSKVPVEVTLASPAVAIATGQHHACALLENDQLWCWGRNNFGQLGDKSTEDRWEPVRVVGLLGGFAISAGDGFTCAIKDTGRLWCWGTSIGISTASDQAKVVPTKMGGPGPLATVSAGDSHACVITLDGSAWCWGSNLYGELGTGNTYPAGSPQQVPSLVDVVAISARGERHTCAVTEDGEVWCWGRNHKGQLGIGTTEGSLIPVQVTGLTNIVGVVTASDYSCAWSEKGDVWCWGDRYALLGDGTTGQSSTVPANATALTGVAQVATGYGHTCVRKADGTVWCWGKNSSGQVGDGSYENRTTPLQVQGMGAAAGLTTFGNHSCAWDALGSAWCWGANHHGQLGNGGSQKSNVPVQVLLPLSALQVSAGADHTCAISPGGVAWCWGGRGAWQLGDGLGPHATKPVPVFGLDDVESVTAAENTVCAILSLDTGWCWGRNESGMFGEASLASQEELPVALPPLADIEKLDIGIGHGCVVKSNGTMWCWGRGTAGQLGNGQNVDSPALVQVANLLGSNAISAGHNTSCASTLAGEAWCWGSNNAGQLGDGSTQSKNTPSQVLGGDEGFVGIDAGQYYTTCAWKDDGTAWCWGNNLHGQLGNGTTESSSVPVQVAGLTGVVEVSVGREYHACARTAEGAVWCWGGNFSGQLGDGSMLQRPTPVQVSGLGNATSVAVGWNHSCAATEQGDVWCWGRNTDGQLGDGTTANKWSPSKVLGLDGVAGVAAGADHTCAWTSEGKAWCWGRNTYGQLGDGSAWAEEPVQVIGFPF